MLCLLVLHSLLLGIQPNLTLCYANFCFPTTKKELRYIARLRVRLPRGGNLQRFAELSQSCDRSAA
jgi:hypothetical protein